MNSSREKVGLGHSEILALVLSSLRDVLATETDSQSIPVDVNGDTRLLGRMGLLDSMGLVALIVEIEQRLEEEHDLVVVLADERAMSQEHSPFRSVASLTDHICRLVQEQALYV